MHLTVENPVSTSQGSTTVIDIDPNSSGLPGIEQLRIIVGAVMTVGLILSVLALIVSAKPVPPATLKSFTEAGWNVAVYSPARAKPFTPVLELEATA